MFIEKNIKVKMSRQSKDHVFGVTLRRRDRNTPWGLRIVGGADLGTPIIVTRVSMQYISFNLQHFTF